MVVSVVQPENMKMIYPTLFMLRSLLKDNIDVSTLLKKERQKPTHVEHPWS